MLYSLVTNGVPAEPAPLPFAHGDITGFYLISDPEVLASHGFLPFDDVEQPAVEPGERADAGLEVVDGRVVRTWSVRPATEEESAGLATYLRAERQRRLTDCDWTQAADAPLTDLARAAWAVYRQALRDLTEAPGFPWTVSWPDEPAAPYDGVVPPQISRFQALAQLADTPMELEGQQTDALTVIEALMAGQPRAVRLAFEETTVWLRQSPMVLSFAAQFGWDDEALDAMFRAAAARAV